VKDRRKINSKRLKRSAKSNFMSMLPNTQKRKKEKKTKKEKKKTKQNKTQQSLA
jgi:hypothetical protein